jgi:hypothetical protein
MPTGNRTDRDLIFSFWEVDLVSLISTSPLSFELICKDTTLKTVGDAVRLISALSPEERDTHCWKVAIRTLNSAIKEPRYITAATITMQSALDLSGMLAQPPKIP